MDFVSIFRGMFGILLLVGIAFILSNNKKNINWRLVVTGLGLQFVFALLIIKGDYFAQFFSPLGWPKAFLYMKTWWARMCYRRNPNNPKRRAPPLHCASRKYDSL